MRPLAEMPLDPPIQGLCFDIDDTFTTDGLMTAEAFAALERWHASGRVAVAVTGRPAGWCDHFARMWPVDAVVGENGAFSFSFDRVSRRMRREFVRSESERAQSRQAFDAITQAVLKAVPGAQVASDQAYRISDLAIDFAEDCGPLGLDQADQIAAIMRASGMTAKVSSIHVNGWFGDFDKLSTTRSLMSDQFGLSGEALAKAFIYLGDSPNDSPMFSFFERSIGVANVARYEGLMDHWPTYICRQSSAAGFAEALQHILHKGA
jgi:HAD superfamily hydrolase (TIGR01484 family)